MKQDHLRRIHLLPGIPPEPQEPQGEPRTPQDHKKHRDHRGCGGTEPQAPQDHKNHRIHRVGGTHTIGRGGGSGARNPGSDMPEFFARCLKYLPCISEILDWVYLCQVRPNGSGPRLAHENKWFSNSLAFTACSSPCRARTDCTEDCPDMLLLCPASECFGSI